MCDLLVHAMAMESRHLVVRAAGKDIRVKISESAGAGVIEPTITVASYWVPERGVSLNLVRARAGITYTLTLYAPQGLRLADWGGSGKVAWTPRTAQAYRSVGPDQQ